MLLLANLLSIVSFVCMILFLVKAFQTEPKIGWIGVLLLFVTCGIGTFVLGWMKANEYGQQKVMMAWSGALIGSIALTFLGGGFSGIGQ